MDFPTKNSRYTIQQSDFGTPRYNETINRITIQNGYKFDFPVYATKFLGNHDYKVLALVDNINIPKTIKGACIVVSSGNIKEIYAFTKHNSTEKGIASLLLSTLIDYHRTNNTGVILWVGVQEENKVLLEKVYKPLGFYFPSDVTSKTSPLGNTQTFSFFSGFWSSTLEPILPYLKLDSYVILSDTDENTKKVREMFFSLDREIGGLLHLSDEGYLKVDAAFQSSQVSQCDTEAPMTSSIPGYLFNYHTHPRVCHEQSGLFLGFPSVKDYTSLVRFFLQKKGDGHFVFTVEGVFFIQPHPLVKHWIKSGNNTVPKETITDLSGSLSRYLTEIGYEEKRRLPIDFYNPRRGDTIMSYTPDETQALTDFQIARMNELLSIVGQTTIPVLGIPVPFFIIQFLPHASEQKFLVSSFSTRSFGGRKQYKEKSRRTRNRTKTRRR